VGYNSVADNTVECTSYNFRLPSLCQKLSDLVEVWRSYKKNNFVCFFETLCSWKLVANPGFQLVSN